MRKPAHQNRYGFKRIALVALGALALVAGRGTGQVPEPLPTPPGRLTPLDAPQDVPPALEPPRPSRPVTEVTGDYVGVPPGTSSIIQAQCSGCGRTLVRELPPRDSGDCCTGDCIPGGHCQKCEADSGFGRLYCHLYNAFQCADPCYEPKWVAGANAALFVETARPATMMRFRWDNGRNMVLPDRSEYFWARIGGKGPGTRVTSLNYNELYMYTEAGGDRFSFFVDTPYRSWTAQDANGNGFNGAGFADIILGTKTLMIDTELAQLTLQTKTWIPSATPGKGVGTGHVSLEPSLILAARLHQDTYFQGQLAEWIPLGGDGAGPITHYHASLNHIICRAFVDSQLIATLEAQGYCFNGGTFTDPATGAQVRAAGGNYFSIGPGVRWVMSERCDFGFGVNFAVTKEHWANQLYRTEFRLKF